MSVPARLVGGVAGVAAGELIAAVTRSVGPTDAVARLVADRLPLAAVEAAVFRLHRWDKTALRLTSAATLASLGAGAAGSRRSPGTRLRGAALALAVTAVALRRPPRRPGATALVAVTQTVVAAAASGLAQRRPIAASAATAAAVAAAVAAHRRRRQAEAAASSTGPSRLAAIPPTDGAETWGHPTPLVTPLDQFHVTDVNFGAPAVRPDTWRLVITGEVAHPGHLDLAALLALGTVDVDAALVCIHNRVGWERAANARWQGVPLASLRDLVETKPTATHVVTRSVDGFITSLPVVELEASGLDSYIVVGMNGQPLTSAHGFPARFLVPGLYGQFAGVKWLTGLDFTDRHVPGDWERRGWPPDAVMARTHSRIDGARQVGATMFVSGVAWAPPDGVAAVELSVDGGPWVTAELADSLGPLAWRRWRYRPVLAPGTHRIRARAARGDGQVQDGEPRPPFPSGATGYHEVIVTVADG